MYSDMHPESCACDLKTTIGLCRHLLCLKKVTSLMCHFVWKMIRLMHIMLILIEIDREKITNVKLNINGSGHVADICSFVLFPTEAKLFAEQDFGDRVNKDDELVMFPGVADVPRMKHVPPVDEDLLV